MKDLDKIKKVNDEITNKGACDLARTLTTIRMGEFALFLKFIVQEEQDVIAAEKLLAGNTSSIILSMCSKNGDIDFDLAYRIYNNVMKEVKEAIQIVERTVVK